MFSKKPWLLFISSRPTLQYTLIRIYVSPLLLRFHEDAYAIVAANIVCELLPLRQEHMFPQLLYSALHCFMTRPQYLSVQWYMWTTVNHILQAKAEDA